MILLIQLVLTLIGLNISLYITNSTNQSFSFNNSCDVNAVSGSCNWTLSLANGNYTWNCLAYDSALLSDWGDNNRTVKINYTVPVDNPPYWSSNQTDIVATYSSTTLSYFNITWEDDIEVSLARFESNYSLTPNNYTMNNITASVYNYSAILPAGSYYWKSYAKDSSNQWNETETWTFTIAQAASTCALDVSSSPVNYGTQTMANCSCTNPEATAVLYRNGTDVTATENGTLKTLPAGDWYYICNVSSTQNYTSSADSDWVNVTKIVPAGALTNTEAWTVTYPTEVTIGYSESNNGDGDLTYKVYRDGADKATGETVTLDVATYDYILNTTGGQNYTANSSMDVQTLTVQQNTTNTCTLSSSNAWSYTYGAATTLTCNCEGDGTTHLYFEGVEHDEYNDTSNVFAAYPSGAAVICNITSGTNYGAASDSNTLTIAKASSTVNLTLDGVDDNLTVESGSTVVFNVTLVPVGGFAYLFEEGGLLKNTTTPFGFSKQYVVPGDYLILANYSASENYTSANENHTLTVEDTTDPVISVITPLDSDILGWTVLLRANVTDLNLDSVWYEVRNGTVSDPVIDSGLMNNYQGDLFNGTLYTNETWPYDVSLLNSTDLTFVVYANDSSGNVVNSSTYWTLDNTQPSIQFVTPLQTGSFYNSNFSLEVFLANHKLNYSYYNITNVSGGVVQSNSIDLAQATYTWTDLVGVDSLSEGNYTVNVFAEDSSETVHNTNVKSSWFYVDKTAPNASVVSGGWVEPTPADNAYTNVQSQTFNMTCNESFIDEVWIDFNGTLDSTPTGSSGIYYWWTFSSQEGTYAYTGYCNDTAGNLNQTETRTLNVDIVAPAWSDNKSVPTTPATYSSGASYQFNVTWSDNYNVNTAVSLA
ncbi:hypothetical protein ACFL0W_06630 [Nanoarchaeota archaeon]